MKCDCPNCDQHLQGVGFWEGCSVECPSCHHVFQVPAAASVVRRVRSKGQTRRALGEVLVVVALLAGVFGYAMHHYQETPRQLWQRLSVHFLPPAAEPVPVVSESVAPAPVALAPTPAPARLPEPVIVREPEPEP